MNWVDFLKRQSDNGQHMKILSGLSSGTCWELANDLEQFINTIPSQAKPLTNKQIKEIYENCDAPTGGQFTLAFARAIEQTHGIKGEE
jgi:hypothetical protein